MCEKYIDWLPLVHPQLGTWLVTQACALTGSRTSNLSVCRLALNPLSHTSQGIVVLICISLMNNDVEYLFMCLWAICISSLKKYLFKFFAYFWVELFLLLLSFMSYPYILDVNPLSATWFANTFPHSVGCLFTLLIGSFVAQILKFFIQPNLYIFKFSYLCLWCHIQEFTAKSNIIKFLSYVFFWEFYSLRLTFRSLAHF